MNRGSLARRSLTFFWRTHLGVALGVAVATTVLVGALVVGDSVRESLREQTTWRIGQVDSALLAGDRLVRSQLANDLESAIEGTRAAPVLRLDGVATNPGEDLRANGVRLHGIDDRFLDLALASVTMPIDARQILLNEELATQLDADVGDEIVLRVERPSAMPRDMVLSTNADLSIALRVEVVGLLPADGFGRFALDANQVAPYNAFVDLRWLQQQIELDDRANLILLSGADAADADRALGEVWDLEDTEIEVDTSADRTNDILSRRIFIDEPIEEALASVAPNASGLLTYFVNELRAGERAAPYSMVCASGPIGAGGEIDPDAWSWRALIPADLADTELVANRWLTDDLAIEPGDEITVTYYVLGAQQALVEKSRSFRLRSIVELSGPHADPLLMPDFPGLSDSENCRDWEPGIPIDLDRIRDKDETYWDDHRGTPKAFITLAAGRAMWSNRFGGLTAVRLASTSTASTMTSFRERFDPSDVGLFVQDIRTPALAASRSPTDFGGLFLGLSLFLIIAALLLIALLFALGVEQRAGEIGTLLAVGFRPRAVRGLLLRETLVTALCGAAIGAILGLVYTRLILYGLETIWRDAVGATRLAFHASPGSITIGVVSALLASLGTIWFSLRRQVRRTAADLLRAGSESDASRARGWRLSAIVAVICLLLALAIVSMTGADRGPDAAGAFFGAGALLLISLLAGCRAFLLRLGATSRPVLSRGGLGARNGSRRAGRSLAVVALIACGTFLVVAVGANRLDAEFDARERASGTGGFAFYAESTIGVPQNLNSPRGLDDFALDVEDLPGVSFVPLRLRAGDDASCLNLSAAQQPRLLGVDSKLLAERDAFSFAQTLTDPGDANPWTLLDADPGDGIPAVADQNSLLWAMKKTVGDTIDYRDERGRPVRVRIVAAVANSILQGNLLISEANFQRLFPSESGYQVFLIDAPEDSATESARRLTRSMSDVGLEVKPAANRLAEFNAVQNTYLAIFQMLGGLGLLIGSAGLGMVVLRNILERRSELALLRAVGFRTNVLRRLIFTEHGILLLLGLAGGTLAALVAVLPALRAPGADLPVGGTVMLVGAIAISGVFWVWVATLWGMRGRILAALRNE